MEGMSTPSAVVSDIFGPIVDGASIEESILRHLHDWMPVYLREMELQLGYPADQHLPAIRSFTTFSRIDRFDEQQLPGLLVFSPGLARKPTMEGDGTFTAIWNIGVAAFVSARDQNSTNQLAKVYAAAVRGIILQKPDCGGVAFHTEWMDESYDDIFIPEDERTISTGVGFFEVAVDSVLDKRGGPRTYPFIEDPDPETQPGSQWPEAQDVIVDVESEGVN
jgi:hypothetical protein